MVSESQSIMRVQAERQVSIAHAQLVTFETPVPADNILQVNDAWWLDLCLTPRPINARARYRDHWGPQRFEKLGSLFLLPAGEALQARSDSGGSQTSILCHLKAGAMEQWFDGELRWTDRRLEASLNITEASVKSLLYRLVDELRHPGFASEALVELIAAQLAIELGRYCARIIEDSPTGGLASWRLKLIEERVREVREAPSLVELADLCGMSVRQLTPGFSREPRSLHRRVRGRLSCRSRASVAGG